MLWKASFIQLYISLSFFPHSQSVRASICIGVSLCLCAWYLCVCLCVCSHVQEVLADPYVWKSHVMYLDEGPISAVLVNQQAQYIRIQVTLFQSSLFPSLSHTRARTHTHSHAHTCPHTHTYIYTYTYAVTCKYVNRFLVDCASPLPSVNHPAERNSSRQQTTCPSLKSKFG